jgi:aminoglycoside phosphotransferase (APT) family kinase protein
MELDIEDFNALELYLAQHISQGRPVSCKRLLGGVSNRTVRVTLPDGRRWVLKQALAKLRVAADWFSSPERMATEAKALRWLNRLAPAGTIPSFIFEDAANHLMAMEAVPDEHENWKSMLLSGRINPDYFEQFGSLLGTIHRRSAECSAELCRTFADTTYFESLRLEPYYLYTAQRVAAAAGFLKALAQETLRQKLSLVHGDFSPKNALIYQGKLILLDYEVVHFGDPAFDVGFALTHFLSKAHHLLPKRRLLLDSTALFWPTYLKEITPLGWEAFEARVVRHTLGCLLARVAGKSPLEYLTSQEGGRQQDVVLRMIANPPTCIEHLIHDFMQQIESHADN